MAWECRNRFWHGTRTYMISKRTNPPPHVYTASLTAKTITKAEKGQLINCVKTWPGGTQVSARVINATVADIQRATPTG
jgi:arginine repressor